nr:hypothetical protein [Tanacetum cinerariifolium]
MEQASATTICQQDKGKNILTKAEITNISQLSAISYNSTIEAIVYRKWTSKTTKTKTPTKFYCILIDRQGTPMQANIGLRDAEYFDQLLQLKKAYLFTGFSCEPTDSWERTLPTEITLIFGRYLQAKEIATTDFPEYYFKFAAYNELSDQLAAKNPILTDYIGRIRSVGRIVTTRNATATRKSQRAIDIKNLSGNTIGFTLWDEMALNFNVSEYDSMEKPVIIAVSSCYINRYNGLPQKLLSILSAHKNIGIMKSAWHVDKNSKKSNPFQNARTMDHKQLKLTVNVNDGSTTTSITCFSDQANTLTRDVNEVLAELTDKNPFTLPPSLRELEGTTHIFQFHFDTMVTSRRPGFILDNVFEHPVLALPPPAPIQAPEPYVIPEGHHTSPEAKATLTNTSLGNPDLPEPPKPHTLPATISQPTIIETNIITSEHEPMSKEGTHKHLPKASTRKALFEHQPETDPTEVSKKHKKDP